MHEYIRERLEDLLAAAAPGGRLQGSIAKHDVEGVGKHLQSCAECSRELEAMKAQSALLHTLRAPDGDVEPDAGFYARVIERIEQCAKDSIWSVFVYSPFGKRLAFASLAIAALLSTYVVSLEARDGHLGGENLVAQQQLNGEAPCFGSQAQQRDAVLLNFASSQGSLQ
jgi:anti-sigma factor RsiW